MKKILIFTLLIFLFVGCEDEFDVPYLSDSDEIERYIADDDLGKIFFSTENLITELPYRLPFDTTAYYVDLLDSMKREINSFFLLLNYGAGYADPWQDFGPPFGESQDAEVAVRDRLYIHTIRVSGIDTVLINEFLVREYNRYGYFMKLGNDGQKFSGWILRGFNGKVSDVTGQLNASVASHANGEPFFAGLDKYTSILYNGNDSIKAFTTNKGYKLLNGDVTVNTLIERVSLGEELKIRLPNSEEVFYTFSYKDNDSTILSSFAPSGNSVLENQLQVSLSTTTNDWGFIYFQGFTRDINDTTGTPRFQTLQRSNNVIPFKIE